MNLRFSQRFGVAQYMSTEENNGHLAKLLEKLTPEQKAVLERLSQLSPGEQADWIIAQSEARSGRDEMPLIDPAAFPEYPSMDDVKALLEERAAKLNADKKRHR